MPADLKDAFMSCFGLCIVIFGLEGVVVVIVVDCLLCSTVTEREAAATRPIVVL